MLVFFFDLVALGFLAAGCDGPGSGEAEGTGGAGAGSTS